MPKSSHVQGGRTFSGRLVGHLKSGPVVLDGDTVLIIAHLQVPGCRLPGSKKANLVGLKLIADRKLHMGLTRPDEVGASALTNRHDAFISEPAGDAGTEQNHDHRDMHDHHAALARLVWHILEQPQGEVDTEEAQKNLKPQGVVNKTSSSFGPKI